MFLKLQYLILITYSLYLKCKKYSILSLGFDGDHLKISTYMYMRCCCLFKQYKLNCYKGFIIKIKTNSPEKSLTV